MSISPTEGVHYIFDRYAFLTDVLKDGGRPPARDLDKDTPATEISKAVTFARAMYHPDRQARTGEHMRNEATRMTGLVNEAARLLEDPELRPLYDDRLEHFRKNKPEVVSRDGAVIIDVRAAFFDVSALLADEVQDTRELEKRIVQMTQYDENLVPRMKRLKESMPGSEEIGGLYRDALTQKLIYLTLLEDVAWAKLGYASQPDKTAGMVQHGDEYAESVERALQNAAERDIMSSIAMTGEGMRLGMAKMPLLLPAFNAASGAEEAHAALLAKPEEFQAALGELAARARQNFDIRAEYVRDVARQKQSVLEELVALTHVEQLHPGKPGEVHDFYLLHPGEKGAHTVLFRMEIDTATGKAEMGEMYGPGTPFADIRARGFTRGSHAVLRNPEITDIMIEIAGAMERFMNGPREKAPPSSPAPKV